METLPYQKDTRKDDAWRLIYSDALSGLWHTCAPPLPPKAGIQQVRELAMYTSGPSWPGLWGPSQRAPTNSRTVIRAFLISSITFKQNNCSWIIHLMP